MSQKLDENKTSRVIYKVNHDTGRSATSGDVTIIRVFGPGQSRNRAGLE